MKNVKLFLLLIALSAILATGANAQEAKVKKGRKCQCTQYVRNRFGIVILKGSKLRKNNYVKKSRPAVGDIVIFKPNYGDGVNPATGHVGVIYSVTYDSKNKCYEIIVRGANQKGLPPNEYEIEYGCNNVSNNFTTCVSSHCRKLQYWRKRNKKEKIT